MLSEFANFDCHFLAKQYFQVSNGPPVIARNLRRSIILIINFEFLDASTHFSREKLGSSIKQLYRWISCYVVLCRGKF